MRDIEHKKQYNKERYDWLKSKGICTGCACKDASVGSNLCPDCFERKLLSYKPVQEQERLTKLQYQRQLRKSRIDMRLCTDCAKKLKDDEGTRCKACAKRHSKRTRPYALTYDQCRAKGLCVQCRKEPAITGRAICSNCLEVGRKRMKLMWEAKRRKYGNN